MNKNLKAINYHSNLKIRIRDINNFDRLNYLLALIDIWADVLFFGTWRSFRRMMTDFSVFHHESVNFDPRKILFHVKISVCSSIEVKCSKKKNPRLNFSSQTFQNPTPNTISLIFHAFLFHFSRISSVHTLLFTSETST